MCFARDVLRCVMGVGVVCLILTSSWMENETCFLNFKQDEAFLAALMQKKADQAMTCSSCLTCQFEHRSRFLSDIFWSPSWEDIIAYHSYISIIHEEELATLCHFTMSCTFFDDLCQTLYIGGLSTRVYGPPSGTCRDSMFSVMVLQTQVSYPYSRISSWILENVHLMT
jgi:hypothetical protein